MAVTKVNKAYRNPTERVAQARLRLLAAAKIENENSPLPPFKRIIGLPAIVFAFGAGFITGFYPPVSKTIAQQAPSLLRRWFTNQMNH